MKILHTSDWHLGQSFKGRSREEEHRGFLNWLLKKIEEQSIDVLIVAGDIFDTSNPPNYALKMYHNFLAKIIKTNCKDIVLVAGNHDGVSTLEVSKDLLKSLNIHVVASGEDSDEVLVKIEKDEQLQAIVCAVPYLRDRVLRNANESKTSREVESELKEEVKNYYKRTYDRAKELSSSVPIIATGHFTTSGATISEDSERKIGTLENIDSKILSSFDYVAMGHIHRPQRIAKTETMRYSGSPLPLSFSETGNKKSVVIVAFDEGKPQVSTLEIPLFKELHRINGSLEYIKEKIEKISNPSNPPFVEVILKDNDVLNYDINEFIVHSSQKGADILIFKRDYEIEERVLDMNDEKITLQELKPEDVFAKRLQSEVKLELDEAMKQNVSSLYAQVLEECKNENN